jgi:hypothetical protein
MFSLGRLLSVGEAIEARRARRDASRRQALSAQASKKILLNTRAGLPGTLLLSLHSPHDRFAMQRGKEKKSKGRGVVYSVYYLRVSGASALCRLLQLCGQPEFARQSSATIPFARKENIHIQCDSLTSGHRWLVGCCRSAWRVPCWPPPGPPTVYPFAASFFRLSRSSSSLHNLSRSRVNLCMCSEGDP